METEEMGAHKLAKPLMRVSGGHPAGMEDFIPLNPWGRGFPKDLLNRPPRPPLFQVIVRDKANGNKELRVGPKWPKESAEMLCQEISRHIALGLERQWTDPLVVKMTAELQE